MSLEAIIIEDQPAFAALIRQIAAVQIPHLNISAQAGSVMEGLALLRSHRPDLVFLDIQLHHETAFDLLEIWMKENGSIDFEPIFITAEGTFENALKAFRYFAVDFLTKPVEPEKFKNAVKRAEEKIKKKNQSPILDESKMSQMLLLLDTMRHPEKLPSRITFQLVGGIYEFVDIKDILYLEADGPVTHLYINSQPKPLSAAKNLGHYSQLLTSDYHFFQISQSLVINLDYIKQYRHNENELVLTNGKVLLASRRGGQHLKDFLLQGSSRKSAEPGMIEKWMSFWKSKS